MSEINHLLRRIRSLARYIAQKTSHLVDVDELFSHGEYALVHALQVRDPARDFRAYAVCRCRGAMLDYLRNLDPLTRRERRAARGSGARPSARSTGINLAIEHVKIDDPAPATGLPEFRRLDTRQLAPSLRELDPISQFIIWQVHVHDAKAKCVAAFLGYHESRVSQLQRAAVASFRLNYMRLGSA